MARRETMRFVWFLIMLTLVLFLMDDRLGFEYAF